MSSSTIVVTQPNHDYTTRYISAWAEELCRIAVSKGHHAVKLKGNRATRKELESVVNKVNPRLLFLNGHGSDDSVRGQDNEVLVQLGVNESILKSALVYALSCRSASILGKKSVESGTISYLGYTEDFIFMYDVSKRTRPLEDKTAGLFLDPSNLLVSSLLKGHTAEGSLHKSKSAYRRTLLKLLTSEASAESNSYLPLLLWDMNHQVCLGDQTATILS